MDDIVKVIELTKFYGSALAVDHISFDVKEGEVFGFLGPNGAGKTTTIRMMVGLTQPNSGTVVINGHDVLKESVEVKRTIGLVPQSFIRKKGSVPLFLNLLILLGFVFLLFSLSLFIFKKRIHQEF
jgi:ABC-2 type transport system ATP-binding protein